MTAAAAQDRRPETPPAPNPAGATLLSPRSIRGSQSAADPPSNLRADPPGESFHGVKIRPHAGWADADIPVVLRLPDVHAPRLAVPAPPASEQEERISVWQFVSVAVVGLALGMVGLRLYRGHEDVDTLASKSAAAAPFWETWLKLDWLPEQLRPAAVDHSKTANQSPAQADGATANLPAATSATPVAPISPPATSPTAVVAPMTMAGGGASAPPATPPDGPPVDPRPRPRNPHFGPTPAEARGEILTARRESASSGQSPPASPGTQPGAAESNGPVEKPNSGSSYDSARPSLH